MIPKTFCEIILVTVFVFDVMCPVFWAQPNICRQTERKAVAVECTPLAFIHQYHHFHTYKILSGNGRNVQKRVYFLCRVEVEKVTYQ